MTNPTNTPISNEQYLQAMLTWLRIRLKYLILRFDTASASPDEADTLALQQAAKIISDAETTSPPPPLVILRHQFGLSRFEQHTLFLCVAMELDTGIAALCTQAQGNPLMSFPTFSLALILFESPSWDVLSPQRGLRYWRLIEVIQKDVQPLTVSPLRADERIVNYVKGLNYLDDRLVPLLKPLTVPGTDIELPDSQQTVLDTILRFMHNSPSQARIPFIQLLGIDSMSKKLIAWHVAHNLSIQVYYTTMELILSANMPDIENLARLWQRESRLLPIALYIDMHDVDEDNPHIATKLEQFLTRSDGIFFLGTRDVRHNLGYKTLDVDVSKPTPSEQQSAWSMYLGDLMPQAPSLLAGQFNLDIPTIRETVETVITEQEDDLEIQHLWDACLVNTRPRLDSLAQRLEPKATWNDIIIDKEAIDLLQQIGNQVQNRELVYEDWGFRRRTSRGLGIVTLFAGESGTGKTMAAEVLANELRLNLYRIDLSAVVSKYIGETEKNLRNLFDAAEDGGTILFFDEADALFGKRSQVKDSHDRYANIETNYLLQRIEAYRGLAILATNMKSGLDEAFTRRIRFIINFPIPDENQRRLIWQKIFPPETPRTQLDFGRLGNFVLAGGSIYNAALNAAFLAAHDNTAVSMEHVLHAVRTELLKSDRLVDESIFAL